MTIDERKQTMGLKRYEKMRENRNEKQRITKLIIEALGEPEFVHLEGMF